jgi:hypothetical protein
MMTLEERMNVARLALVMGPEPAECWSSSNPPTDVTGKPRVYHLPTPCGECLVDRWLVALAEKHGPANAVNFLAEEIRGFEMGAEGMTMPPAVQNG